MARFLFGPVNQAFADDHLRDVRAASDCLCFDVHHPSDLVIGPDETWDTVQARLPWIPDAIFLYLPYRVIPPSLWSAPMPLIGLAGDWNLQWHYYRRVLRHCDLVLTDTLGVQTLRREGILAQPMNLFGCGRGFIDWNHVDGPRDIDILFVGNFNPSVQSERLPWLARLTKLHPRWKVVLTTNVFGDDYRNLLSRSKIAFNLSVRGECNSRVFEAITCGALLFQEEDNREVSALLRDREECVLFSAENLETLLDHFLAADDERRRIANNARARIGSFTFEAFLRQQLRQIESEWRSIKEKVASRRASVPDLETLVWMQLGSAAAFGPSMVKRLTELIERQPRGPGTLNALGTVVSQISVSPLPAATLNVIAQAFQDAWNADPRYVVAGLNLAETLMMLSHLPQAEEQAMRTLAVVESNAEFPTHVWDAAHFPTTFDEFRVEWEKAAWTNAGVPQNEAAAKKELLRWRLHQILALLKNDVAHAFLASAARPKSASSLALVGDQLLRQNRLQEAASVLRRAVAAQPFARDLARALHKVLGRLGLVAEQQQLAAERLALSQCAPNLVPTEDWFAEPIPSRPETEESAGTPLRIAWHGSQTTLHSLTLVNRELCERLAARGHELAVFLPAYEETMGDRLALPPRLHGAVAFRLSAAPEVHVGHQWPPDFSPPESGHWVILQPWEFGSLPKAWLEPMSKQVDEVWVPSSFVRECFVRSGVPVDQVNVVPNGVSSVFFSIGHSPYSLQTRKRFKFLFVGGTIQRKGIDILLRAYSQLFSSADDVCLVIKDMGVGTFYRDQTAGQMIAQLRQQPHAPEIEYLSHALSTDEMAGVYRACDCLVHPYRGEGFGLPIAEAMACELPVIVTGYGAALDFCSVDTGYLIPARTSYFPENRVGEIETVDRPWLAEPDLDALRVLMRHVIEHPDEAKAKAKNARAHIASRFTWDHAVAVAEKRLLELRNRPVRRFQTWQAEPMFAAAAVSSGRPRVSLTMIVKNEEKNLSACLDSVVDLVDEIVLVDTGSTDATKDIARRKGARIFDFPWIDNFSAARNESLRHANGDWIFWMDADDRLDAENRGRLRRLLAQLPDENVGYVMKCLCLPDTESGTATIVDHLRLFRNLPDIRWSYRVHEQILPAVRRAGGAVRWSDVVVHHIGYQDSSARRRKLERDFRLLTLELQERPDDAFTLFNLGAAYREQGKHAEALTILQRSLDRSHPQDSIVRKLFASIAQSFLALKQPREALKICQRGREIHPDDVEILFQESLAHRELNDRAAGIRCLEEILALPPPNHFASVDTGLRSYKCHNNLAVAYHEEGRFGDAEKHWHASLADQRDFLPALLGLGELYLAQSRWERLDWVTTQMQNARNGGLEACMLQARKHVALNDFQQAKSIIQPAIDAHPKEIWPRVVLSHALLKEGADSFAAEKALREILALDPNHKEARRNLETLLLNRRALAPQRQLGAPSMGAAPTSSGAPVNVPQLIRSMDKPRVSFCMIVRNGEGNLDACLKSVADLADEMIVVDTGSTDRTKEIAISAGAKVLDFAWQDSFAAARNESLRHANCRWIFWLDADETLDEENRSRLRRLFSGLGQENVGYLMRQFSPLEYAPEAAAYVDQVRLFPAHPEIRWQYRVHEQILLSIRRLGGEICATDIVINHSGFIDPSIQGAKVERNLRLLTIEHDENPNDYFVLFNLGAVAMTQGRLDEAIQFLQRSLTNTHPTDTLVPKIFSLLARCFLQQGKRDDALAWCRRGLAASPGDAELTFWEAVLLREQGAFADAERCLKQILNQPRQGHMASVDAGLYGFRTKHLLAEVYRLQGQNLQAESLWKEIVAEAPTFGPARLQLGELYLEQGRWDDLANVTASLSQAPQPNPEGMSLKARALLRRKEFAESRQILEKLIAIRPDALEPRLLLSYTFLQEGRDLPAAERSLRAILAIAPDHAETRHNLAVLMQQMKLQGS